MFKVSNKEEWETWKVGDLLSVPQSWNVLFPREGPTRKVYMHWFSFRKVVNNFNREPIFLNDRCYSLQEAYDIGFRKFEPIDYCI